MAGTGSRLSPPAPHEVESERSFVGTESRLLTLFDLLRQMSEGSDADPATRPAELERRRADIDAEIAQVRSGDIPLLNDQNCFPVAWFTLTNECESLSFTFLASWWPPAPRMPAPHH